MTEKPTPSIEQFVEALDELPQRKRIRILAAFTEEFQAARLHRLRQDVGAEISHRKRAGPYPSR